MRILRLGLALLAGLAVTDGSAPASAIEPATVIAAVGTAKELAEKGKAFLKWIGYMPGDPDPNAHLLEKLDELQQSLARLQTTATETLEVVHLIENEQVRVANEETVNRYIDAVQYTESARIALRYLAENPGNVDLMKDADVESRRAINEFESRPQMFREVGPRVSDIRFRHTLAYPGYLAAIAVRLAFIQTAYGSRGFTHEPYRSELWATDAKLRQMIQQIHDGLETTSEIFGHLSGTVTCSYASVELHDHISFAPAQVTAMREVDIPEGSCDQSLIDSIIDPVMDDLRTAAENEHGVDTLNTFVERVDNYANHGQAGALPPMHFPDWIMGELYTDDGTAVGLPSPASPGVALQFLARDEVQHWKLPVGRGFFQHEASQLCLTSADGSALTMEVCTGAADQVWVRQNGGSVRHEWSGQCLSWMKLVVHPGLGHLGGSLILPRFDIHLRACDGAFDQRWYPSDPTTPIPIH